MNNQNTIIDSAVNTYLTEKAAIIENELRYAVDNYDDSYCSRGGGREIVSSSAYVLFYRRKDFEGWGKKNKARQMSNFILKLFKNTMKCTFFFSNCI